MKCTDDHPHLSHSPVESGRDRARCGGGLVGVHLGQSVQRDPRRTTTMPRTTFSTRSTERHAKLSASWTPCSGRASPWGRLAALRHLHQGQRRWRKRTSGHDPRPRPLRRRARGRCHWSRRAWRAPLPCQSHPRLHHARRGDARRAHWNSPWRTARRCPRRVGQVGGPLPRRSASQSPG